jgi:tRNA A37 threonylcarbamoyladenosine modification protein TsaB
MDDFCVVIDAGRDFYYAQAYSNGKITLPACYLSKEQVQNLGKTLVGFEALALDNYQKISLEGCLYNAIMRKGDVKTGELSALYIRKSQAEENRK